MELYNSSSWSRSSLGDYKSSDSSSKKTIALEGLKDISRASGYLQVGDMEKATRVLQKATRNSALDEAASEDARIQLEALKGQQAILGLTTRQQRLYLSNRSSGEDNSQRDESINANPYFNGNATLRPNQIDGLLVGNSLEENQAIKRIAARIVSQQLATESAATCIGVEPPLSGEVLTFTKNLQVQGDQALKIEIDLVSTQSNWFFPALALAILLGLSAWHMSLRRNGSSHS